MSQIKRRSGIGWWLALLACAFLYLASIEVSSSFAQTGSPPKASDTLEGDDGTEAGDPDIPTGESPGSGSGGSSDGGGNISRGHGMTGGITAVAPEKQHGLWAQWKNALRLLARNFFYIR